jgi:tetratricopeptide (TPR) repeat protein
MSDRNDSNVSVGTFLKNFSAPILTIVSFISSVYGFVKLFADKDAGLVTLISLIIGILLLLGICLYYARFWQPEQQNKGRSPVELLLPREPEKAQAKREKRRKWIRRLAIAGLILIPILSVSGVAGWNYVQSLPPKDIIVLVAEFDSPDSKNFGVTETVIRQLRQATEKYSDVKIQALSKTITEQEGSEVARTEGAKHKATIAIWGWYRNTGEVVPLSVNFEILRPPKNLPKLGQTARGQLQQAAIADLKSFTLQTRLSNEMSYLSLFTLGMTRVAAADWDGAIARFSDALSQRVESTTALDQSLVYFHRGTAYLQKSDNTRALADFDQAIKLQPKFAKAYVSRSAIHLNKGDFNRALGDGNQAIELQPDLVAYNNRGLVYLATGDSNRAIADFTQALKLLPDTPDSANTPPSNRDRSGTMLPGDREVPLVNFIIFELGDYVLYVNRGNAYLNKKDYDRALADFNQAIKLQPSFALAYFNRSSLYSFKKNYDLAVADLNQVIKLQPDFALAYMKRGAIYVFKEDYDRAIADLNQAIKLQPDLILAYAIRGTAQYNRHDYNLAISDYDRILKLKPDDFETYDMRGNAYAAKGDYDRAIADYNQAIKLKPDLDSAYLNRGISYKNKGDYDRAIADYNQAIKLKPDYAWAYNNRGNVYQRKGDYDRTLADYNQAIKLDPNTASFYNNRGYTYALKGDYDRALADANQALKLEPNPPSAYDTRGFAFAGKGDFDRAIADYNQAIKAIEEKGKTITDLKKNVSITYDVAEFYYHRGLAYRQQGKKDRAISDFKKTLELTQEPKMRQDAEKQLKELDIS